MNTQTNAPVIVPGSPEHDAAMIALAQSRGVKVRISDGSGNTAEYGPSDASIEPKVEPKVEPEADPKVEPQADPNATLIDGKFKDTAALLAAYKELERKQSTPAKPAIAMPGVKPATAETPSGEPAKVPATPPADTAAQVAAKAMLAAATDDAAKAVAQQALDAANAQAVEAAKAETPKVSFADAVAQATASFNATGAIAEADYVALEAAGVTREYADAYARGQKAQAEVIELKVFHEAGGKDNYSALANWAAANWSPAQIDAHNVAVHSGDLDVTLGAIRTLKAAQAATVGIVPETRIEPKGGASNTPPVEMYASSHEMQADMRNPKYLAGDRAFHALVDKKLAASMAAGIKLI